MKSIEVQLSDALEHNRLLIKINTHLKAAVTEQRIRTAKAERELRMHVAGVSLAARGRLHAAFAHSTDNAGLKEAINVELRGGL